MDNREEMALLSQRLCALAPLREILGRVDMHHNGLAYGGRVRATLPGRAYSDIGGG